MKRDQCIDIKNHGGTGNVQTYQCEGLSDQYIMKCDDGTLRN